MTLVSNALQILVKKMCTGLLMFSMLFFTTCFATTGLAQESATILPLGDSITAGGGGGGGFYRHHLQSLLAQSNFSFKFVGPKQDSDGMRHAGYSGANSSKILDIASKVVKEHPADIVLLHMAHNHFIKNKPVPLIVRNTRKLLNVIWDANPNTRIYLAQAIPAGKLPKYSYIPELNTKLGELAAELKAADKPITLVNQASGFDWTTDTVSDKVHPNEDGARKMAANWAAAILSAKN